MKESVTRFGPGGRADVALPGGTVSIRGICGASPGETSRVVFLRQVHSAAILKDPSGGEEADGMIMGPGSPVPGLRVADCLPVMLAGDGYTAAFHAGWRGLAAGIAGAMIRALPKPPLWVFMGPCICPECYGVGPDVRESVLRGLPQRGHPPGGLDLSLAAMDGMLAAGLPDGTAVHRVNECTRCRRDLFHSHRADGTARRNMVWLVPS